MENIRELALNIVGCVILINIIDTIVASNALRKYIKLFCGFVLIMVVISPSKIIINDINKGIKETNVGELSKGSLKVFNETVNKIERVSEIKNQNDEKFIKEYIRGTHKDIENVKINVKRKEEQVEKVILRLKSKKENIQVKEIKNWVCRYFNILEEQVEIRFN